jgi:hypothetical protein
VPKVVRVEPMVTARGMPGALDYLLPDGDSPIAVGRIVEIPLAGRVVRGVVVWRPTSRATFRPRS